VSGPHWIVAGGCTSGPPFREFNSRRSKENRDERPRPEPTSRDRVPLVHRPLMDVTQRAWQAVRRALRKARPGA